MPYVICVDCELSTYSAALWASTDECPRCGAVLPAARRSAWLLLAEQDPIPDTNEFAQRVLEDAAGGGHD